MEYIPLCTPQHNCQDFSRLVMGTDHLVQAQWRSPDEKALSEKALFSLLDEAVELGINFFDTSPIYVGGIENRLGKWMRSRQQGFKQNLHILSKGGFPFDLYYEKQLSPGGHSPALIHSLKTQGILKQTATLEEAWPLSKVPPGSYASRLFGSESLIKARLTEELKHTEKNIQGQIDVYLMHRDDNDYLRFQKIARPQTAVNTIMKVLNAPEIRDKYSFIGWSNWETPRVEASLRWAQKHPEWKRPLINSPYFSLFEMSPRTIHAGGVQVKHAEMMNPQFQAGIHIMPYSPLGGFSILDQAEPRWLNAKKAAHQAMEAGDPYWQNVYAAIFTPENEARYQRLESFTQSFNQKHHTNYSFDQMINAYVLAHPQTHFLAIGPRSVHQLRRTVAALKLAKQLTPADLDYLHHGK